LTQGTADVVLGCTFIPSLSTQLSMDVPTDADLLCNTVAVIRTRWNGHSAQNTKRHKPNYNSY